MALLIGIYGDTHAGYDGAQGGSPADEVHAAIVAKFIEARVNAVVNLGDHVHVTAVDPWPIFDAIVAPLCELAKYRPVLGNHENPTEYMEYFFGTFPPTLHGTKYWIIQEGMLFVVIEVYHAAEAPPSCTDYQDQIAWLQTVLYNNRSVPLKVVCWHRPAYSTGVRGSDLCARVFNDTLKANGVDVVFSGHTHAYERFLVNGTQWIVSGGAGGVPHPLNTSPETLALVPLREASAETYNYGIMQLTRDGERTGAQIRFYDLSGNLIDELSIVKSAPVEKRIRRTAKIAME